MARPPITQVLRTKVGADPTGMAFNSVTALEPHDDHPQSPLVNAGAIASVSLVPAANAEGRWAMILAFQSTDGRYARDFNDSAYSGWTPVPSGLVTCACCCAKPPDHRRPVSSGSMGIGETILAVGTWGLWAYAEDLSFAADGCEPRMDAIQTR